MNKRLKSILTNVLVLSLVYFAVHFYQTRLVPVGQAPMLSGWLLEGKMLEKLGSDNKPTLVHFWATWCSTCKLEQGSIESLHSDYNVVTLASQSGGVADVKKFLGDNNLHFPVIVDQSGALAEEWGIVGYPTSFIVDKNNVIRFVEVGFTTEVGLKLRLWFADYFT